MKNFWQFVTATLILTNCAVSFAAQVDEEISDDEQAKRGIKIASERLKKEFPVSVETRIFFPNMDAHVKSHEVKIGDDALNFNHFDLNSTLATEYIFRYKNFSVDYLRLDSTAPFLLNPSRFTQSGEKISKCRAAASGKCSAKFGRSIFLLKRKSNR